MRYSTRFKLAYRKVKEKLKGYRTALVGVIIATASVIDLSDIADLLPDGKHGDVMYVVIAIAFIYMRHITDSKPGWKQ